MDFGGCTDVPSRVPCWEYCQQTSPKCQLMELSVSPLKELLWLKEAILPMVNSMQWLVDEAMKANVPQFIIQKAIPTLEPRGIGWGLHWTASQLSFSLSQTCFLPFPDSCWSQEPSLIKFLQFYLIFVLEFMSQKTQRTAEGKYITNPWKEDIWVLKELHKGYV